MMETVIVRNATHLDERFLKEMFVEAVLWHPEWPRIDPSALLERPELARYFAGWGRPGDRALIAVAGASNERIGAGWFRTFTASEPGYGFVSSDVPELGIAVTPAWRDRGAGTVILRELLEVARRSNYAGLSLSVHPHNPARRLYERMGFREVARTETAVTLYWSG